MLITLYNSGSSVKQLPWSAIAVKFEEENIYISMTTLEEHSLQK